MSDYRITCIIKPNIDSPHEHITHVGNSVDRWMMRREDVIKNIENKTNTFYVLDPVTNTRADVGVFYPGNGRSPFIKTYSDGDWNNNLLSLNQCPLSLPVYN